MNDYWFLCRDTGIIKYFGSFADYDEADAYLLAHGLDPAWIFSELPKVETTVGGEYNLVVGDSYDKQTTGDSNEHCV
jgi:hypothetical protein